MQHVLRVLHTLRSRELNTADSNHAVSVDSAATIHAPPVP